MPSGACEITYAEFDSVSSKERLARRTRLHAEVQADGRIAANQAFIPLFSLALPSGFLSNGHVHHRHARLELTNRNSTLVSDPHRVPGRISSLATASLEHSKYTCCSFTVIG